MYINLHPHLLYNDSKRKKKGVHMYLHDIKLGWFCIFPANRAKRSIDYPGLAFGSAMFGSDTLMKFSIIKNELHNIMRSHLKRVDGEVVAMAQVRLFPSFCLLPSTMLWHRKTWERSGNDEIPVKTFPIKKRINTDLFIHGEGKLYIQK